MSRIKQEWHDLNAALDFAEKAVAANPREARYHLQVAEVAGDLAQRVGVVRQLSLGRRFKKEVDATVALDPKNIEGLQDLVAYYFVAPGIMGGDKARARQTAAQIMQIDVEAGYIAQIQLARLEQQQHAPFEEIYRKMVAARPESYEGRMQLGGYLAGQKKYDEAMEQAREALRIDPGRIGGHTLAAAALAYQGKWPELDAILARAEKEVPDDLQPYFRAADACLSTGADLPRAERYYRKYSAQEPEPDSPTVAAAHWRLGQALEKEGRKAEAIAEWQTAVKFDANSRAKEDLKRVK
jgi:tetratricopeptide (TPR) repeat protein